MSPPGLPSPETGTVHAAPAPMSEASNPWRALKRALKPRLLALHGGYVRRFRSFGDAQLLEGLRGLGIHEGDSVMLHSGFGGHHGYRGSIEQLTDTFIGAVGPAGHLLMVSLPYRSSSLHYLQQGRRFDVRRTPSMMGLVSEFFRRRPGVLRSLHPTHPVLVHGPDAAHFVAGHEDCLYPCGPGTPFERLAERDGLVAFFDVPFATFTFFHHLEHLVSAQLPFALYTASPYTVPVVDHAGQIRSVTTYVFAPEAIRRRRFERLEQALRERGLIARRRIGNTWLEAVRVREVIACVDEMRRAGHYFYDLAPGPDHPHEGASAR